MADDRLQGFRILVVEDEYLLADDISDILTEAGAHVIGPCATVADAVARAGTADLDAAILDINLRGDMVFPVADALAERRIPFIFATGYDQWSLPDRFADAVRLEKPLKGAKVVATLGPLLTMGAEANGQT